MAAGRRPRDNREVLEEFSAEKILCDLEEVGRGGFGTVLRGKHETTGDVAVKCFEVTGGERQQSALKKKILREYNNLLQSRHENIVIVFGTTRWPGSMGIVMQYCEGGNLKVLLLDQSIALGLGLILRMNLDIASAVAYIHNCGLVERLIHGDLKPENILLTLGLICKISDFGSAQIASYTGSTTIEQRNERQALTPYYAAPERLLEGAAPKKEQDAYSCGVIQHSTLCRVEPYQTQHEFDRKLQQGLRPNCEAVQVLKQRSNPSDREIIEVIERAMGRCWSQEPSQRPDMATIRDEFRAILAKQDPAEIAHQVAVAVEAMDLTTTPPNPTTPLNLFSTEQRRFFSVGSEIRPPVEVAGGSTSEAQTTQSSRRRRGDHLDDVTQPKLPAVAVPTPTTALSTVEAEGELGSGSVTEQQLTNTSIALPEYYSKFLAMGGESVRGDNFATRCVKYEATTSRCREIAQLITRRVSASSVKVNNKVYIMGGADNYLSNSPHRSGEVLDWNAPTSWSPMLDMLYCRKWFGCDNIGDNIYVTGGYGGSDDIMKKCEKLEINLNEWIPISDIIHGRYGHETVVVDGSLYCIGGYDDLRQLETCERLDPREGQWRPIANMNQARAGFASAVLDGKIYAIGGYDGSSTLTAVERYIPAANRWENVASLHVDRTVTAACTLHPGVYVIGGHSDGRPGRTDVIERYFPATDTWEECMKTEKPISGLTVVSI